jgi:DNA-binding HxlR family transcriptional regulator
MPETPKGFPTSGETWEAIRYLSKNMVGMLILEVLRKEKGWVSLRDLQKMTTVPLNSILQELIDHVLIVKRSDLGGDEYSLTNFGASFFRIFDDLLAGIDRMLKDGADPKEMAKMTANGSLYKLLLQSSLENREKPNED